MLQAQIIPIGNSYGLRLPRAVLDHYDMVRDSVVNIVMKPGQIILKPELKPVEPSQAARRKGWAKQFAANATDAPENLWGDMAIDESWDD
jgi:antitoxin component of MazEF toxin-antitoxin module